MNPGNELATVPCLPTEPEPNEPEQNVEYATTVGTHDHSGT